MLQSFLCDCKWIFDLFNDILKFSFLALLISISIFERLFDWTLKFFLLLLFPKIEKTLLFFSITRLNFFHFIKLHNCVFIFTVWIENFVQSFLCLFGNYQLFLCVATDCKPNETLGLLISGLLKHQFRFLFVLVLDWKLTYGQLVELRQLRLARLLLIHDWCLHDLHHLKHKLLHCVFLSYQLFFKYFGVLFLRLLSIYHLSLNNLVLFFYKLH